MISFLGNYLYDDRNILDEIGLYVQECGGHFAMARSYNIEFFIPVEYRDFILIKYPFLKEVEYIP
jgi:hypothetical protein